MQAPSDLAAWGMDPQAVDATENVIYIVDGELKIAYCNPAWDRFASQNGGELVLRERLHGCSLRQVVPAPLARFYDDVFGMAREQARIVAFDYECSSPELYRLFRMQIRFLPNGGGFALVNSLRLEHSHHSGRVAYTPESFLYEAKGLVTMCSHCRRTRRQGAEHTWDWVPEHLRRPALTVSHGLCPVCIAHYYPDEFEAIQRRRQQTTR